ncbi:hypothetical protein F3Y22_tig00111342pilonHSYRG00267 [Hibiscus syriacus]|uniref:Reverse transcriptase zinc-binding domain-containing protein n=1 Tax=Hibiscus syriacus TaxID=106335 RepID=A0A6A2YPE7_HIBSY|nr:hypothetical protein F3Y22_tig00111342pilonHSYRG00267 [Hibiscus syriacus]
MLPSNVIPRIMAIKPRSDDAGNDRCVWKGDFMHRFGVKDAYRKLVKGSWNAHCPIWNTIWTLQIPQRIRTFLWLVLRDRIASNYERYRRGLTQNPACSLCGFHEETTLHVLRDCQAVKTIWSQLLSVGLVHSFFTNSLDDWIRTNLACPAKLPGTSLCSNILFPTILWQIWKRRNCFVFTDSCISMEDVLYLSSSWASHFVEGHSTTPTPKARQAVPIQWRPPPNWWCCVSMDASVNVALALKLPLGNRD